TLASDSGLSLWPQRLVVLLGPDWQSSKITESSSLRADPRRQTSLRGRQTPRIQSARSQIGSQGGTNGRCPPCPSAPPPGRVYKLDVRIHLLLRLSSRALPQSRLERSHSQLPGARHAAWSRSDQPRAEEDYQ
ncbi:hypothetical protein NHX12_029563, partial [Muraenolepis orangiensis]